MNIPVRTIALLLAPILVGACADAQASTPDGSAETHPSPTMTHEASSQATGATTVSTMGTVGAVTQGSVGDAGTVYVFKSATCGCCSAWIEHMEAAGFTVEAEDTEVLADVKRQVGLPSDLQSCHTAIVDGLIVEGHVPAQTVQDVLADRGDLAGIAVPGMPIGSPGMEMPGQAADAYDVIGFTKDGARRVVERH